MATTYTKLVKIIQQGDQGAANKLLKEINRRYYADETPLMTDPEYDQVASLYASRFGLEFKTGSLGRTDRQTGIPHEYPLLAGWLDKAADLDTLRAWFTQRVLTEHTELYCSPKWDGMSIVVSYDATGVVTRVLTRGEDGRGVDVTRIFGGEQHFTDLDAGSDFGIKSSIKSCKKFFKTMIF